MVPVDLAHVERQEKALRTAADLSKHYGTTVCYVGVTPNTPNVIAHNPAEYAQKLESFGKAQATVHGLNVTTKAVVCQDLTTDVDDALLAAVHDVGADLVVMASHIPDLIDYVWPSNGGKIAEHSDASVFVVR